MPKLGFSQLPLLEEEICLRVRQIRVETRLSQAEFAKRLGETRDRIASYEYARAPIRWVVGDRICHEFNINQRWLAEGKPPRYGYCGFADSPKVGGSALYSEAYPQIAPLIMRWIDSLVVMFRCPVEALDGLEGEMPMPTKNAKMSELAPSFRKLLPELIASDVRLIPDALVSAYFQKIASRSEELRSGDFRELKSFLKEVAAERARIRKTGRAGCRQQADVKRIDDLL